MEIIGEKRIKRLEINFNNLDRNKQVVLSIVFAKRLLELSHQTLIVDDSSNMSKIENVLSVIKRFLFEKELDDMEVELAFNDSKHIYTNKVSHVNSHAISSASIIETILSNLLNDKSDFSDCLITYIDSIDLLVQEKMEENQIIISNREQLEKAIMDDELMKSEISLLEDLIKFISIRPILDAQSADDIEDIFVLNQTIIKVDEKKSSRGKGT